MSEPPARNIIEAFANAVVEVLDAPVTWFRGLLILLNSLIYQSFVGLLSC